MKRDAEKPVVLDYQRPPDPGVATNWAFVIAYVLIILPIVYTLSSSMHAATVEQAVTFYVLVGLAFGAGLFVTWREPQNVVGWYGLVVWGALCLLAIINALLE